MQIRSIASPKEPPSGDLDLNKFGPYTMFKFSIRSDQHQGIFLSGDYMA
jgi:hypothetical protein